MFKGNKFCSKKKVDKRRKTGSVMGRGIQRRGLTEKMLSEQRSERGGLARHADACRKGSPGKENLWCKWPQAGPCHSVSGTAKWSVWEEKGRVRTVGDEVREIQEPDHVRAFRARIWLNEMRAIAGLWHDLNYALKDHSGCCVENHQEWARVEASWPVYFSWEKLQHACVPIVVMVKRVKINEVGGTLENFWGNILE